VSGTLDLDQSSVFTRSSVSGGVLVLLIASTLGILTVGNAFALDLIFGVFRLEWLAALLGIEVLIFTTIMIVWPNLCPAVRWDWLEMLGMVVVGSAFVCHAVYLAPSNLMPVSSSVDCSHQHLLVNFIYERLGFPENINYLYIYDDYPVGPSTWAALIARGLGFLPVQTMYPLAVALVAIQVMVAYGVSVELLSYTPVSCVLAALASLTVFLAPSYTVDVFASQFYSNMMMGDMVVLFILWVLVVGRRMRPELTTLLGVLLVMGCLQSYPAWLPFCAVPIIVHLLFDQRLSKGRRWILGSILVSATVTLAIIAVIDQWDFITWFAPSRDRRLIPGWHSLGGGLLALVLGGVWIYFQDRDKNTGFMLFVIVDTVIVLVLYAAAWLDLLTLYIPDKTFYFNIYLFVVFVALGISFVWNRLFPVKVHRKWASGLVLLGLFALAAKGANSMPPRVTVYPITLDEYKVAYQIAQKDPDIELTYLVRTSATFYWMYGSILNHTHDLAVKQEQWIANRPTYSGWIEDSTAPRNAIVSDISELSQDGKWRVVLTSGNSGLIEKVP